MTVHNVTIDGKIFLGRADEQKQFKAALLELLESNDQEHLPYICLLHGDGGIGKTTLAKRFGTLPQKKLPLRPRFKSYGWIGEMSANGWLIYRLIESIFAPIWCSKEFTPRLFGTN